MYTCVGLHLHLFPRSAPWCLQGVSFKVKMYKKYAPKSRPDASCVATGRKTMWQVSFVMLTTWQIRFARHFYLLLLYSWLLLLLLLPFCRKCCLPTCAAFSFRSPCSGAFLYTSNCLLLLHSCSPRF